MGKKKLNIYKINDNHSIYNLLGIRYGVKRGLMFTKNEYVDWKYRQCCNLKSGISTGVVSPLLLWTNSQKCHNAILVMTYDVFLYRYYLITITSGWSCKRILWLLNLESTNGIKQH